MVFFTCNACGESLKKAQVEKHVAKCRNCQCLSCIDCGKDFWGEEYKTHLKCLTEDEKYGGKGFEAKGFKGDVKQQQWIQRIQEVMKKPNISNTIRNILNQMSTYDNIPRKKAKFQNWIKNSLRVTNQAVQDQVWEIFAEASSNEKDNTNNNANPSNAPEPEDKAAESSAATEETEKKSKRERKEERQKKHKKEKKDVNSEEQPQNGTKKKAKKRKMEEDEIPRTGDEEATGKKKKKHRKREGDESFEIGEEEAPQANKKQKDSEGEEEEEPAGDNGADENVNKDSGKRGKFNWKGTIKALLRQAPDHELPIKKLRKKVIAQYYVISSEQHKSEEELLATFNKKIHKNPTFRVLKERVKLVK